LQPFLVANFQTGIDKALEPWLTPQDAFTQLENGYIFRGVLQARKGYDQLATGGVDDSPGRPSILYTQVSETVTNGATLPDVSGTLASTPIQPGSVSIEVASGEIVTDTGVGTFTGDVTPDPGGTINYVTGVFSFTYDDPAAAGAITATYSVPGNMNPIMGIFNFINNNGERKLVVLDTQIGNRLNPTSNLFVYIPTSADLQTALGGTTFTGTTGDFWSGTMYPDKNGTSRLILVNNVDTPIFFDNTNEFHDYTSTTDNPEFTEPPTEFGGTLNTALHVFYINERLVFLRPTMNSIIRSQRILWSGINDSSGAGDKFTAPSAGYIDIPDGSQITAAIKQNNSLIIWTSESVWVLSITTSADAPFSLRRVGDADYRGSQAPYSAVDWFSQAAAMGRYGIVGTDTRSAYRIDNKLPFFTRDDIEQDNTNFRKVTSGTSLEDSQWWMTYPTSDGSLATINDETAKKILVYGFEEKNWMKYDIPINVLGQFKTILDIPWDSVNNTTGAHPEWDSWDVTEDIWDQFYGEDGRPFTVGGDQNGYIHRMNLGTNDICANISNVTYPSDLKTQVTTDYNGYNVGDIVSFANVVGCEVDGTSILNGVEAEVTAVSSNVITVDIVNTGATAYTSGGVVCEGFECEFITKPLNPFVDKNKKCKLHKVLFLVSQSESDFFVDFGDDRREGYYRVNTPIDMSNNFGDAEKKWYGVTVNQTANFHRMRIHRRSTNQSGAIHAFLFLASPVGRLYT
jgi:hypothetical protein